MTGTSSATTAWSSHLRVIAVPHDEPLVVMSTTPGQTLRLLRRITA